MVTADTHRDGCNAGMSTKGQVKGRYQASVKFHEDSIRIVVSQPADVSSAEREAYNSAHRQCLLRLVSHPPRQFDVIMSGITSAPVVEVSVKYSLVEKLPLLREIATSIDTESADPAHDVSPTGRKSDQVTEMMMPCSVWGFISLLLLIEGDVTVQQWFDSGSTDGDPSLPAQTLEVACYLDCTTVRKLVMIWLQQVLEEVLHTYVMSGSNSSEEFALQQMSPRLWHLTQVLRLVATFVPQHRTAEMLAVLTSDASVASAAERAVHLPQDLLAQWVASVAPELDLQGASLSSMQWSRVLMCISHTPAEALHTLHIPLGAEFAVPKELQEAFTSLQSSPHNCIHYHCCAGHGNNVSRVASLLSVGAVCTKGCGNWATATDPPACDISEPLSASLSKIYGFLAGFTPAGSMPARCNVCNQTQSISASHLLFGSPCASCSKFSAAHNAAHQPLPNVCGTHGDVSQTLSILGGFAAHMTSLKHLGLQNLHLTVTVARNLGQLLNSLPLSVTRLTLGFKYPWVCPGTVKQADKVLLFRAIALLRSLKELHMPEWEAVVGSDAAVCVQPLRALPHLDTIFVAEMWVAVMVCVLEKIRCRISAEAPMLLQ